MVRFELPSDYRDNAWPVRGTPGGWRDIWEGEDVDLAAAERARRFAEETARVAQAWRAQPKPTTPLRRTLPGDIVAEAMSLGDRADDPAVAD